MFYLNFRPFTGNYSNFASLCIMLFYLCLMFWFAIFRPLFMRTFSSLFDWLFNLFGMCFFMCCLLHGNGSRFLCLSWWTFTNLLKKKLLQRYTGNCLFFQKFQSFQKQTQNIVQENGNPNVYRSREVIGFSISFLRKWFFYEFKGTEWETLGLKRRFSFLGSWLVWPFFVWLSSFYQ
jgi:hypothetical protein